MGQIGINHKGNKTNNFLKLPFKVQFKFWFTKLLLPSSKFNEMSNLLQNQRVNLRTRINFLDSLVRSRLTYACQNWNLTKNQFEILNVSYRSFLRRMIRNGQKFVNPTENDYRFMISNERLHEICHARDEEY